MSDSEALIEVIDLKKEFGNVNALNGINLLMKQGTFGLIGPNGAGKTTLILALLGLIKPSSGNMRIFGLDVRKESILIRRRLGILHENPTYPMTMTVTRYLRHIINIHACDLKPSDMLSKVGLEDAMNRKIGELSAGMRQRLGIAIALVGEPELVILDEPTSNLDVSGRTEIEELIINLYHETNTSFFISSHLLSELERTCRNVAFIKSGIVIEQGEVSKIIENNTTGRFHIITSDPTKLGLILSDDTVLRDYEISGINTITVQTHLKQSRSVLEEHIISTAAQHGIEVFTIQPARSLEDAYKVIYTDKDR